MGHTLGLECFVSRSSIDVEGDGASNAGNRILYGEIGC